jgi:uncharacterized membrane protein YozB (DUF420 family)
MSLSTEKNKIIIIIIIIIIINNKERKKDGKFFSTARVVISVFVICFLYKNW